MKVDHNVQYHKFPKAVKLGYFRHCGTHSIMNSL